MKRLCLLIMLAALMLTSCRHTEDGGRTSDSTAPEFNIVLTEAEKTAGILTPEILWKFGRLADPQVSPNGENLAYTITYYDVTANVGYTHVFVSKVAGSEPMQITTGEHSCYNPRWVDNERIAFLSTETGTAEIWIMQSDGSAKTKISNLPMNVNSFKLSPAGDRVLFFADVPLDSTPQDVYADLPQTNVIMADDLMYRHWNSWHDYAYSHPFVADFSATAVTNPVDIMPGERFDVPMSPYFDDAEINWSPDGKNIAYTCKKMSGKDYALSTNSDIYIYNLDEGTTTNITEGMLGYDKYPVFSPDASKIAWQSMATPGFESDKDRLFVMDLATREKTDLTENFDYGVANILWDNDTAANNLYFITCINATHQIFGIDAATKVITQLTDGCHDINAMTLLGDDFLVQQTTMAQANELFAYGKDGSCRQVTNVNKEIYDNIEMSQVRRHFVKTTDDKDMLVWEILPPHFDSTKVYPAILYCEGGPQSPVSQFFSYRWNFMIMAANGYVVVAPNRRGLPGFGTEWNNQISGDYGGQNMLDYLSAINAFKSKPYIDADRIGAVGASYGGFSVFWLAGHNQDSLFKAFIAHCGMFNLESQYASTEEMFFVNHDLGGPYWEKDNKIAQKSFAASPHHFVQNWNAPILIITGGHDFRIPYTEGLQAFNAAQLNGVESKILIFPDESHFVLQPQNAILWQREFKSWLDKHLK